MEFVHTNFQAFLFLVKLDFLTEIKIVCKHILFCFNMLYNLNEL